MPGEEGYSPPTSRAVSPRFYERAGVVDCLGSDNRRGSVTRDRRRLRLRAATPPSPSARRTMRIVKVFWGLDSSLAYARHFPAIN